MKTYVRPKLEFNTPVWSPYLANDITKVENVQKRFTKFAFRRCGIPYISYQDRLFKINLKSLQHRRILFDLLLFYKIFYGLSDLNFSDFFKLKISTYNLRGNKCQVQSINNFNFQTNQLSNCFFNRVTKYWNYLPQTIVESPSLNVFKSKLKDFDFDSLMR